MTYIALRLNTLSRCYIEKRLLRSTRARIIFREKGMINLTMRNTFLMSKIVLFPDMACLSNWRTLEQESIPKSLPQACLLITHSGCGVKDRILRRALACIVFFKVSVIHFASIDTFFVSKVVVLPIRAVFR